MRCRRLSSTLWVAAMFVAAGFVPVFAAPQPAAACICFAPSTADAAISSDAVFTGTVRDTGLSTQHIGPYSSRMTIAVDEVFKGSPANQQVVWGLSGGCADASGQGARILVFAHRG